MNLFVLLFFFPSKMMHKYNLPFGFAIHTCQVLYRVVFGNNFTKLLGALVNKKSVIAVRDLVTFLGNLQKCAKHNLDI